MRAQRSGGFLVKGVVIMFPCGCETMGDGKFLVGLGIEIRETTEGQNGTLVFCFGKVAGILADQNACTVGFIAGRCSHACTRMLYTADATPRTSAWYLFALTQTLVLCFVGQAACTLRPTGVGGIDPSLFPDRPTDEEFKPTGPRGIPEVRAWWLLSVGCLNMLRKQGPTNTGGV